MTIRTGTTQEPRLVAAAHLLAGAYLVVACVVPFRYGSVLAALAVAALAFLTLARRRMPLSGLIWTIILSSLGLLGVIVGLIRGNPGAMPTITVYVAEPIVFGLLFPMLYQTQRDIRRLLTSLDVALVVSVSIGAIQFANAYYGLSLPIGVIADDRFTSVSLDGLRTSSNFQAFNALVFLAPYAVVRMVDRQIPAIQRGCLGLSAAVGVMLSGRQAIVLVVAGAAALLAIVAPLPQTWHGMRAAVRVLAAALASVTVVVFLRNARVESLLDTSSLQEGGVRADQAEVLLRQWESSPLVGIGAGGTTPGLVRSEAAPWQFELSYHATLMGFGLLGAVILAAFALWVGLALSRVAFVPSLSVLAILAGFAGALLANSSNPYLTRIEGMWMIFVPFGVAVAINSSFRLRRGQKSLNGERSAGLHVPSHNVN